MIFWRILSRRIAFFSKRLSTFVDYVESERRGPALRFIHDGGIELRRPNNSLGRYGLKFALAQANFEARAYAEPLLRRIVDNMFRTGYLSTAGTVVDIGSWLGDNALPWAARLDGGRVIAIDPAVENLEFSKVVASVNGLENIEFVNAVCAERQGIEVSPEGNIRQTKFRASLPSDKRILLTETLESCIRGDEPVTLLHLDVEGYEARVLRGAQNLIEKWQPVIIFESHLGKDFLSEVTGLPALQGWKIFMINEAPMRAQPDCRNFCAIPPSLGPPPQLEHPKQGWRTLGVYPAAPGPSLLSTAVA